MERSLADTVSFNSCRLETSCLVEVGFSVTRISWFKNWSPDVMGEYPSLRVERVMSGLVGGEVHVFVPCAFQRDME